MPLFLTERRRSKWASWCFLRRHDKMEVVRPNPLNRKAISYLMIVAPYSTIIPGALQSKSLSFFTAFWEPKPEYFYLPDKNE